MIFKYKGLFIVRGINRDIIMNGFYDMNERRYFITKEETKKEELWTRIYAAGSKIEVKEFVVDDFLMTFKNISDCKAFADLYEYKM